MTDHFSGPRRLPSNTPHRWRRRANLTICCFAILLLLGLPAPALAACPEVPGDLNKDLTVSITDIQCMLLVVLWDADGGGFKEPDCATAGTKVTDLDCDSSITVVDAVVVIQIALSGKLPMSIDADGSGCHDECEDPCYNVPGCSVGQTCKSNEDCAPDTEYCVWDVGCSGLGICAFRPTDCSGVAQPICGCDGETWNNACKAANNGVVVATEGQCPVEEKCPPPTFDPKHSQGEPTLLQGMTLQHNLLRAQVGTPPLTWNTTLAELAQGWAAQCLYQYDANRTAKWKQATGSKTLYVGQNIYVTSVDATPPPVAEPFGAWATTEQYYTWSTNQCSSGSTCGHYTQLIWATTTYVGCGVAYCPQIQVGPSTWFGAYMVVCNYAPGGNFFGVWPYPPTADPCVDLDRDGIVQGEDCNDTNKTVGIVAGCIPTSLPTDLDGDGFSPPVDCDDANAARKPTAKEIVDELDNDCDGLIDE